MWNLRARPTSLALITASFVWLSGTAAAVEVTIPLGGSPAANCGDTWTVSGVVLSFVPTESEDCDGGTGACFFDTSAGEVGMAPARLNLDLSGVAGAVTSAEVDVQDFCGSGCTRAFLYDDATEVDMAGNTVTGPSETLALDAGGGPVDRLAVSSCEGFATEVRLEVDQGGGQPTVPISSPIGMAILFGGLVVLASSLILGRAERV